MATKPWGIYETTAPASMTAITTLATQMGSNPNYIQWYKKFLGASIAYTASDFTNILNYGAIPILTWMPLDGTGGIHITNADVIAGTYDTLIDSYATGIKALSGTVWIRLAHEMNGNWYDWAIGQNGNTAASYKSMWQHVWTRFQLQSVANVKWVYCPNIHFGSPPGTGDTTTYAAAYPGDTYVDILALDGYNSGDDPSSGHTWNTFNTVFGTSITDICAVSPSKPFYISEMGCVEQGGKSKASWILDALTVQMQNDSRITAFVWFDFVNGNFNYQLNTSTDTTKAFASALVTTTSFNRF